MKRPVRSGIPAYLTNCPLAFGFAPADPVTTTSPLGSTTFNPNTRSAIDPYNAEPQLPTPEVAKKPPTVATSALSGNAGKIYPSFSSSCIRVPITAQHSTIQLSDFLSMCRILFI